MHNPVYVVHCIDTEGPLYESVEATFERLRVIFHLELEPSLELLRQLQAGTVALGGIEAAVQKVVDPRLLAYNDTWDKVDAMLAEAMSESFRKRACDSAGEGWVYNWFCVDHVDYDINPRRKDIGYHNIFDHYRSAIRQSRSEQDGVHFHYHPHPFGRASHCSATHWWASSNSLSQTISRRVIDRQWFPAANRPGYHVIRPDSHWFLEQFIPFDFSSQAMVSTPEDQAQFGGVGGRLGDWRRAPANWTPYHPSHDDYQLSGRCRRWISRCLNVGTRFRLLMEKDVRQAFEAARSGQPVVLGIANHDYRDLRPDVDAVRSLLMHVAADFPDVPYQFSEAIQAMRKALRLSAEAPCELDLKVTPQGTNSHLLEVTSSIPTFGPQPWLALKTQAGTYHYDNFDIEIPFHKWHYVFDEETFSFRSLSSIGIAANNAFGTTTVSLLNPSTGKVTKQHWN